MAAWSYLSPDERQQEQTGIAFNRKPIRINGVCGECGKRGNLTCEAGPIPGKGCVPIVSVTCHRKKCGKTVTR